MKLIVGLGNPGIEYKNTRHNIGFLVIDEFARSKNLEFKNSKPFKALIYKDNNFILLKPLTYMNLSGESVKKVQDFYKINSKDILIISDDFNLDFLRLRLREKGSSGGHNGLKSIISSIGTEEFNRLRIGLGEVQYDTVDFVLGKFDKDKLKKIESIYPKTNEIIEYFIDGKPYDYIMNHFNVNEHNK